MAEDTENQYPKASLEAVWSSDEEEPLSQEEVWDFSLDEKARFETLPIYKDTPPVTDSKGNIIRQFNHVGKSFLVFEQLPPVNYPTKFHISILETDQPISLNENHELVKGELDKHPEFKQYDLGLDTIAYSSPTIADTRKDVDPNRHIGVWEHRKVMPFDPEVDKPEDKIAKMNKNGVKKQITRLITRLGSPRSDLKTAS